MVSKAYETYISEISKLGRMFFAGYSTFTARPQELPYANLNEKKATDKQQEGPAGAMVNTKVVSQRTAAQSVATKRKTGTVAKDRSRSKKSAKAKKVGRRS
jgi:hypothetical protein